MITLNTDRLIIRDHEENDLIPMHELLSNPEDMYFLPDIKSSNMEESACNLKISIKESGLGVEREKYFFGMFTKAGEYIGEIGYTVLSHNNYCEKNVGLGYFIKREYWKQGYTSDAVKCVVRFAFEHDNVIKIETGCLSDNIGSEKVMIKCGFKKESFKPLHQYLHGKWRDRVEYGLTRDEYSKSNG